MTEYRQWDSCSSVRHMLRCVGSVGAERLSTVSGVLYSEVERCLTGLSGDQFVSLDPGPFGGWSLTESGRTADDESIRRQLHGSGAEHQIRGCYERFLVLNPILLQVCSDWQMRKIGNSPTLNDHSDSDYDAKVLTRLIRIDTSAQDLLTEVIASLYRFGIYQRRLATALDRALAGSHDHVADSLDSYHAIWFQLHEDLLTTLGISRNEERERSQ